MYNHIDTVYEYEKLCYASPVELLDGLGVSLPHRHVGLDHVGRQRLGHVGFHLQSFSYVLDTWYSAGTVVQCSYSGKVQVERDT